MGRSGAAFGIALACASCGEVNGGRGGAPIDAAAPDLTPPPPDLACESGCPSILGTGYDIVVVDRDNLYYVDLDGAAGRTVSKRPLAGGPPEVLIPNLLMVRSIAVDATTVYASDVDAVWGAPIAGGPPTPIADQLQYVQGVAVDAQAVYWLQGAPGNQTIELARKSLQGGAFSVLASDLGYGAREVVLDANDAYVTVAEPAPDGAIVAVPLAGGPAVVLAAAQDYPRGLVLRGGTLYWATCDAMRALPIGGAVATLLSGSNEATGLAVDDTAIYWSTCYGMWGNINRMSHQGSGAASIAAYGCTDAIAVDATNVYWVDGSLVKFPKK